MSLRLKAFGIHLLSSAIALSLVLGALYLGWYRWPGWYVAGAWHVAAMLVGIDVALGPLLTAVVASPRKPRGELKRDIGIIVLVQLAALGYGAVTLWQGRPLYYAFTSDWLDVVQASEISGEEIARARRENPSFVPHWYNRPRWVWAPLPKDSSEAQNIIAGAVTGGTDVVQMPRYFRPWDEGLSTLNQMLKTVDEQKVYSPQEKQFLKKRLAALGVPPDTRATLVMWGRDRPLLAVFKGTPPRLEALMRPN